MTRPSVFYKVRSFCKTSGAVADSKIQQGRSRPEQWRLAARNSAKRQLSCGRLQGDIFSSDREAGLSGARAPEQLRRGGRCCRRRRRGRRSFRGLVLAVAGERGSPSRKGAGPWRHDTQGRLLVLGAQQRRDARVGHEDPKSDCIRYMARLSRPETYDPADSYIRNERLGILVHTRRFTTTPRWPTELLAEKGALEYRHCPDVPDYWVRIARGQGAEGSGTPAQRRLRHDVGRRRSRSPDDVGSAARRDGVDIRTGYRVQRVIRNESDEIVGVEANGASGKSFAVRARKAVIFATGGFTHDVDMRKNFL